MTQPQFLFRPKGSSGKPVVLQAGEEAQSPLPARRCLRISFKPIYERVDSLSRRDTGRREKSHLYINRIGPVIHSAIVEASAAGVKSVLRRLRPQEEEVLDALDQQIAEHQEALRRLSAQRQEQLNAAWQRANVVRLNEVVALADAEARQAARMDRAHA